MLSLLLDENISPEIATQLARKRPDISIVSIHSWQNGRFMGAADEIILTAASEEELTLVTYDQKTIMPILVQWSYTGTAHAGVIFIDNLTIPPNDFGSTIRALIALWNSSYQERWTNLITYLRPEA